MCEYKISLTSKESGGELRIMSVYTRIGRFATLATDFLSLSFTNDIKYPQFYFLDSSLSLILTHVPEENI